ncbi:hypothetical protein AA310_00175 [Arthrobacter sp. YC-RL1]|nr:hypothetical protein AA310_00175 [Arthrobacter sp. YC-RL1]
MPQTKGTAMPGKATHAHTRGQALEVGQLIDVTATAQDARFRHSVALTRAAWTYAVAWDDSHPEPQADDARLWDVLYMAGLAARNAAGEQLSMFDLYRVPNARRPSFWCEAEKVTLGLTIGPGDRGEPVFTVMCIEEYKNFPY